MKWSPKYILIIQFLVSLAIVLNIYNGDILGISSNLEYLLWYIPPLIYFIFHSLNHYLNPDTIFKYKVWLEFSSEILLCILGISCNIYWHFAWIKDAKTNYRHRTEYYDTQCLFCGILYVILHTQFHKDLEKITKQKKKTHVFIV